MVIRLKTNACYFRSKNCKESPKNEHRCAGAWEGFGVVVICDCKCHESEYLFTSLSCKGEK